MRQERGELSDNTYNAAYANLLFGLPVCRAYLPYSSSAGELVLFSGGEQD